MTTPLPELLTPAEVAAILRVSRWAVYRLIRTGQLTIVRLGQRGGRVRIPASSLQRLITDATVLARAERPPLPLAQARVRLDAFARTSRRPA
jgi:excisionase family DNA binding protein